MGNITLPDFEAWTFSNVRKTAGKKSNESAGNNSEFEILGKEFLCVFGVVAKPNKNNGHNYE